MDKNDVKAAARGFWPEILRDLVPELNDALVSGPRQYVRCPLPGHDDKHPSFRLDKPDEGRAICSCGSYDGFQLIMMIRGCDFSEALRLVAGVLNVDGANINERQSEIVVAVAAAKRMPVDAFRAFGAQAALRGSTPVARVPVYNEQGLAHSYFDLGLTGRLKKGLFPRGKGKAGLFFPGRIPKEGEEWVVSEGVKDSAVYHNLGFNACGLNTDQLTQRFVRLFKDAHVVLMPDRTKDAEKKAAMTAARLHGVAASVRIGTLPLQIGGKEGDDARDVLRKADGERLLLQAVADAREPDLDVLSVENRDDEKAPLISNGVVESNDSEGGRGRRIQPLRVQAIIDRVKAATHDWPRHANGSLFVVVDSSIRWLEKTEDLFGYLHLAGQVRWHSGESFVSRAEFRSALIGQAVKYKAIECYPHEPGVQDHYYICDEVESGDGTTLVRFLDFFNPKTDIDRDLLQATLMTMAWGGPGGKRPAFLITSEGRGRGKTTLAESLASVFGGCISFSMTDKAKDIKERLLSPEALAKRVALLDNVKTHKISSGDIEALVTAQEISGKRMYVGEACRPNTMTWFITVNGAALSKDMAQRCIPILLSKPRYSRSWDANVLAFIEQHRWQLIGDVIAALRGPTFPLDQYSRWGLWERDVLEKLPDPGEAQRVIQERQAALDTDTEEVCIIEEHFRRQLLDLRYAPDTERVFIPSRIAVAWLNEATSRSGNRALSTVAGGRYLNQQIDEEAFTSIVRNATNTRGRGVIWSAPSAQPDDEIYRDLESRLVIQRYT